jgi:protein-S-isoprenylcysteine O-methyltransferase Ste14
MKVNITQLVVRTAGMMVAFAIALFIPAGTLAWPAGWTFFLLMWCFSIVMSLWLLRSNPDLLAERLTGIGRPDQKTWDKVFLGLMTIAFFAWLTLMGLDAVRFRWSHVPLWLQGIGAVLLLGSFYIFYITFRENTYLSPAVRVQTERGHTVVSTGPYRYIRHPMYAGFGAFTLGTALLLGSWYGLLGGLLLIGMVAWRGVREEQVLQEELEGYDDYMHRMRYRFIPHVW